MQNVILLPLKSFILRNPEIIINNIIIVVVVVIKVFFQFYFSVICNIVKLQIVTVHVSHTFTPTEE